MIDVINHDFFKVSISWVTENNMSNRLRMNHVNHKNHLNHGSAVRGEQAEAFDHLIINNDGTVSDVDTGLIWQQQDEGNLMSWSEALNYCEKLNLAGYGDWRLPAIKELESIVDLTKVKPSINLDIFIGTMNSSYWSSTTYTNTSQAFRMDFSNGHEYSYYKSDSYYIRAVREGQSGSLDNLTISKTGFGAGTIKGPLNRLDCGPNCEQAYPRGTLVTLTATPETGSTFAGWSGGGCSGTGDCQIKISMDTTVSASFNLLPPSTPTLNSTSPDIQTYTNQSVTVNWNSSASAGGAVTGYSFLWDTSPFTNPDNIIETTQNTQTNSMLNDGQSHYFHVLAVDNAGNTSGALHAGPFYVDKTPPHTGSVSINEGAVSTSQTEATLTCMAWDAAAGVAWMRFSNDGVNWSAPEAYASLTNWTLSSGGGVKTVYARFGDLAGNWTSTAISDEITLVLPPTAPVLSSTAPAVRNYTNQSVSISWHPSVSSGGNITGYSFLWDASPSTIPDNSVETTQTTHANASLADGRTHYFHVCGVDNTGNSGDALHVGPFYIDKTPPSPFTMQTADPEANVWSNDNTVAVSWNPSEDSGGGIAGYSYAWDTSAYTTPDIGVETTAASVISPALADGVNHFFHIRAVDTAGNAGSAIHAGPFYIDTTPPTGTISINNGESTTDSPNVIVGISASDSGSGAVRMKFSTNNVDWTPAEDLAGSKQMALSDGEGDKRIYARIEDLAGNWTTADIYDGILLDYPPPSPPSLKTVSPAINTWSNTNIISLSWNPGESAYVEIVGYSYVLDTNPVSFVDHTADTGQTSYTSEPLSDGSGYYFHIRTVDIGGDASQTIHLGPFQIDTKPPEQAAIVINNGDLNTTSPYVTLGITASDTYSGVRTMQFSNDQTYWSTPQNYAASADWSIFPGDGNRTVYARFADGAGNWTVSNITDDINIRTGAYGRLILLAGGGAAQSNSLWMTTEALVASVYRNFNLRGFTDADIYLMSPQPIDHNADGHLDYDALDCPPEGERPRDPTAADLEYAVTGWAVDAYLPDIPFYIWLIDHGYPDDGVHGPWFMVSPGEPVHVGQLDAMIDAYETATGGDVIVVNESCYSGQFLDPLKKPGRIVVTATLDRVVNYSNFGTNSFTQQFIENLFANSSLRDAFYKASDKLHRDPLTINQTPQLDDNGDGKFNDLDGILAAGLKLGSDFTMGAPWPEILSVQQNYHSPGRIDFTVAVNAYMRDVWATVQPPDYVPDMSGDYQFIDLEVFYLYDNDDDMVYDGSYTEFTRAGTYIVRFYAGDQFGNVALFEPLEIQTDVTAPGDVNGDGYYTLADVVVALKICAGETVPADQVDIDAAVINNHGIGLKDALYVIRKISE